MIETKKRPGWQGCLLAVSFIVTITAGDAKTTSSAADSLRAAPMQTQVRWRRHTFASCERCDGVTAPVTVFADRDGKGKMWGYRTGRYRADRGDLKEVGNDTISSLAVLDGFMVRLCQDEGDGRGAGRCEDFAAGEHNVSDEMDNETSFIWVWHVKN
jgi:hypothetical protein